MTIAELIARKLVEGLIWPGDPEKGIKPRPIALPFFAAAGRPKEMNDLVDETVKQMSEAIVAVIEVDAECDIVPRTEHAEMRRAVGEDGPPPMMATIDCGRCSAEMMSVRLRQPDKAVVDGPSVLRFMRKRNVECPHTWSDDDQS